jgi:transposase
MIQAPKTYEELQTENRLLKEQIEWFTRQMFGKKSEKVVDLKNEEQLYFEGFDKLAKVSPEQKHVVSGHERTKRQSTGEDKITLPADLPIEKQILDIPEEEKVCSVTGQILVKIGEEVSSKLACKPATFYIKQIIRPKYALPQNGERGIRVAALPDGLLNRCQADESLLAEIVSKKFNDHLPL